jgi:hypothetical protein
MRRALLSAILSGTVLVTACSDTPDATGPAIDAGPRLAKSRGTRLWRPDPAVAAQAEAAIRSLGEELAASHAGRGAALLRADWIAGPGAQAMGSEVFFKDVGNKQIGAQWVPGDPRRQDRTNITYAVAPSAPAGLTVGEVMAATDRAMTTWDTQGCSTALDIDKTTFADPTADIVHLGFVSLPSPTLGVTFPFIWVDGGTGVPTDIDNDGAFDYAFALILYSSNFSWAIDGNIDVETVALHEAGHGLGQAHFGTLFQTLQNGQFHFAPRAVLNAGYTGVQQVLTGTDEAGHCSIFGPWPNN